MKTLNLIIVAIILSVGILSCTKETPRPKTLTVDNAPVQPIDTTTKKPVAKVDTTLRIVEFYFAVDNDKLNQFTSIRVMVNNKNGDSTYNLIFGGRDNINKLSGQAFLDSLAKWKYDNNLVANNQSCFLFKRKLHKGDAIDIKMSPIEQNGLCNLRFYTITGNALPTKNVTSSAGGGMSQTQCTYLE